MIIPQGTKLGRYEIDALIGAGGMGEVYLARDTRLERTVALKILPANVASDQVRLRRFVQEARAASTINHPNVAHIYEIEEADGRHFIAMEYVEGETLRAQLMRSRLTMLESLDIGIQVAAALAAAHAAGIAHRDIKPENIMVRRDRLVKVLDFGLAKFTDREAASVDSEAATKAFLSTEPGIVMGTVAYMSPEQARGRDIDERTDIWSLGCVIYEIVAGCPPFTGETATDIIAAIVKTPPLPLARLGHEAPAKLDEIILKALEKDREDRYQGVKDVLVDLKRLKKRLEFEAEMERSISPDSVSPNSVSPNSISAPTIIINSGQIARGEETQEGTALVGTAQSSRPVSSAEYLVTGIRRHKTGVVLTLSALVMLALISIGLYRFFARQPAASPFASPESLEIKRLTTSGKVAGVTVSPDGKYVAYVLRDGGENSIRYRQTATTSDVEIVAPVETSLDYLAFSHDGNFLYYVNTVQNLGTLYRVPALGGPPLKIVANIDSVVALSPDDKQIAFLRENDDGYSRLMLASADGSGERLLAEHRGNSYFWGGAVLSWSPDGKMLACVLSVTENGRETISLMGVRVENGAEQRLTSHIWYDINSMAWISPDSLVISASENGSSDSQPFQLWLVSVANDTAQRMTSGLNDYVNPGVTAGGGALVAIENRRITDLWLSPSNDAARATQITNTSDFRNGLAWTPDGKLLFSSSAGGNSDIWTMNSDGTRRTQLTSHQGANRDPVMTPDGRCIIFISNRTGGDHVWRMNADGSNPVQLTSGSGEYMARSSLDGKWVLYTAPAENDNITVWKVSIDGGAPARLANAFAYALAVSPRDNLIAYEFTTKESNFDRHVAITTIDGGASLKVFRLPVTASAASGISFTPDGRALAFKDTRNGGANLYAIPLDGKGEAKPLTDFKSEQIFSFAWSPDGKQLAAVRGALIRDAVLFGKNQ